MKRLAVVGIALFIVSCAKLDGTTSKIGDAEDGVKKAFRRGTLSLDCVDDHCKSAYRRSAVRIVTDFQQGLYDEVIDAIAMTDYSLDLNYYLLAAIAFRQGYIGSAQHYLELVNESENKCVDEPYHCFETDMVTAMDELQQSIEYAAESSQFKSNRPDSTKGLSEGDEDQSIELDVESSERYDGMVFSRHSSPEYNYDPYKSKGLLNGTYVYFNNDETKTKYFYVLMSAVDVAEPLRHQLLMVIDHPEVLTGIFETIALDEKLALQHIGTTEKCDTTCFYRDSIGISISDDALNSYARTGLEFELHNDTKLKLLLNIPAAYFLDYLHILTNYELR